MFDRIYRIAGDTGNLGIAVVVKVEENDFLVDVVQFVDEFVKQLPDGVGFICKGVDNVLVQSNQAGGLYALTFPVLDKCSVERHTVHPSRLAAFAVELVPSSPKVEYHLLIEIVDTVGMTVGKGKAYLEEDAARTAEHLLEFDMSFFCLFHDRGEGLDLGFKKNFYIYVRCKKNRKVRRKREFNNI